MSDKQFEDLLKARDYNEENHMSRICYEETDHEIQRLLYEFFIKRDHTDKETESIVLKGIPKMKVGDTIGFVKGRKHFTLKRDE